MCSCTCIWAPALVYPYSVFNPFWAWNSTSNFSLFAWALPRLSVPSLRAESPFFYLLLSSGSMSWCHSLPVFKHCSSSEYFLALVLYLPKWTPWCANGGLNPVQYHQVPWDLYSSSKVLFIRTLPGRILDTNGRTFLGRNWDTQVSFLFSLHLVLTSFFLKHIHLRPSLILQAFPGYGTYSTFKVLTFQMERQLDI